MTDGSGGITPVGGLGMLWYPVKQFGDFRLKFQFREGRTDGGYSNGGVFVRFPNPEQLAAAAGRVREGRQRRDAAGLGGDLLRPRDPALRRDDRGETAQDGLGLHLRQQHHRPDRHAEAPAASGRTTRSRSSASTSRSPQRRGDQRVGQQAGHELDRGGDPDTSCASSRGATSACRTTAARTRMQYRDVRVEDLTPGAPSQPTRPGCSRSRASARTRSRSARPTRPATSRSARRSTFEIGGDAADRRRRRAAPPLPSAADDVGPAADDRHARPPTASARCSSRDHPRDVQHAAASRSRWPARAR